MTDSDTLAAEQADATRDHIADYFAAVDHVDDCPDPDACPTCARIAEEYGEDRDALDDYLRDWPLEVAWAMGEPFAVVLGTGGPHTEITGGGAASGSGYVLTTYWAGGVAHRRSASITRMGQYFRDMVEEVGM